ncbi:MAG: hypothetical protein ABI585_09475, partial [Betaproteobacteria bacterium]
MERHEGVLDDVEVAKPGRDDIDDPGVRGLRASDGPGEPRPNLAKKLSNAVASLISVPFQFNRDGDIGVDRNGHKTCLYIQPVILPKLNADWTLISRVIVPIADQHLPGVGDGSQSGVANIAGQFFFSPTNPGPAASSGVWVQPSWCRPAPISSARSNGRSARLPSCSSRTAGGPAASWPATCGRSAAAGP